MCPRRYDVRRRAQLSEDTRRRILDATLAIIGGKEDLAEFSMETVASRAGVARMTVYNQFGSRSGLLDALADHLAEKGGLSAIGEAFAEPDPARAIAKLVVTFDRFWASDRNVLRRLRAMAIVFPRTAAGPRDRDAWRREAIERLLAKALTGSGGPERLPRKDLVDLLTGLTSFETFDALCSAGRTPETVEKLIAEAALALVGPHALGNPRPGGAARSRYRQDPAAHAAPGSRKVGK